MNTKINRLLVGLFCLAAWNVSAQTPLLSGYSYQDAPLAPNGKEWENPEQLALNKEQPHAWFFHFEDEEHARKVLPENSTYYRSLDGLWKFNWVGNPDERPAHFYLPDYEVDDWDEIAVPSHWNVVGIQSDGSLKYGTPIYANQPVIFKHTVEVGDWKGGVMREPAQDWTTYRDRNEVGSYRRTFTLPKSWKDRQVYINFDGVSSFFYLWINGQYVGFSKNSRNTASFDITRYLKPEGENIVAAEVYRNSDGSFLEAQDMFRLPGIFRTVSLTSTARLQVRDLRVFPNLDASYRNGSIRVEADIRNLGRKKAKGCSITYAVYANRLYSDDNIPVEGVSGRVELEEMDRGGAALAVAHIEMNHPRQWSAEAPYRYTLVGQLKDKKGKVIDTFSTGFGFAKVEIKDTPAAEDEFGQAGRYYYINGRTVKLKGVNRQEIDPSVGNAITRKQMEEEIRLMKRGNINHVRNSHYSCQPYWYYLCDKYGIYLEDEANIESHEYYYGAASLSHVAEFRDAHVARVMELAHAHVNHPSVVIWSLGNEAGPGKNFKAAYAALHAFDPSRPVQYERNNDIVDMGSNQYPSIGWMNEAVKGKMDIKYPFHVSEYAHSMGNAVGNLTDYWKAIESTNFFCGAAIWDWVDQSLYYYDRKTGDRFWAYGGDFGDKPNSGMFCMNGILLPDHSPKPAYWEVKKVYQNIGVKAVDMKKGLIEVFNKTYFTPLTGYKMVWSLYKDGKKVKEDTAFKAPRKVIGPREKAIYGIPYDYDQLDDGSEYYVKVQFLLAQDMPWAPAGYVQMEEQLLVKEAGKKATLATVTAGLPRPEVVAGDRFTTVQGKDFVARFDNEEGTIYSLVYHGQPMIREGHGPKIDGLRAPTDNDNWARNPWFAKGLHHLKHRVLDHAWVNARQKDDNTIQLMYTVESQAPNAAVLEGGNTGYNRVVEKTDVPFGPHDFKLTTQQIWTIYPDGSIELQSAITSNDPAFTLARLGYALQLPDHMDQYSYYGRGPWNNYNDRKTGSFAEIYHSTVKGQFVPFPKPQSMGNREDVRWCALTDGDGNGIEFIAGTRMSASALPWSALELTLAPHIYQLPPSQATHLHLDLAVTGLGGNSCGQGGPLSPDRVKATDHHFSFIIRPVRGAAYTETAQVQTSGQKPLMVSRSRTGQVSISSAKEGAAYLYTLNHSKRKMAYTGPFDLRNGGLVTAYDKDNPSVRMSMHFDKIETVPMQVVYTSSEEVGYGDAKHLVDGNPSTLWHTMYSVTVAKYPHWVDFDAGEAKEIKGFIYLPRQDGNSNACIKDYTIHVSRDGKEWGEPVKKGRFGQGTQAQRVMLDAPVKARYIRFTALSSQNGADYAGGAEFSVLAD